jgi:hypothetical protein
MSAWTCRQLPYSQLPRKPLALAVEASGSSFADDQRFQRHDTGEFR